MSRDRVSHRLRVLKSRETDEAIYVAHPKNILKYLFLPKSQVSFKPAKEGGLWHDVDMPEWLAEEHRF